METQTETTTELPVHDVTPEVEAISKLPITGNVIPASWLKHIKNGYGSSDLRLCHMLSEIVYWYRWTEVRDEQTGELLGFRKKFKGDYLRRGYQEWADMYLISVHEAKREIKRLRDMGLIQIIIRHGVPVKLPDGGESVINNVVYVVPVAEKIAELTELPKCTRSSTTTNTEKCTTSPSKGMPSRTKVIAAGTTQVCTILDNSKENSKESSKECVPALAVASACPSKESVCAGSKPAGSPEPKSTLQLTADDARDLKSQTGVKSRRNGFARGRFPDQKECIAALPKELWEKCADIWEEFIGIRYRTGKPICRTSLNNMIEALKGKTPDQAYEIIKYSVVNCYPKLYPDVLKRNGSDGRGQRTTMSTWQMKRKTELLEHRLQELIDDCPSAIDSEEYRQKQREIAEIRWQIAEARRLEFSALDTDSDECCD